MLQEICAQVPSYETAEKEKKAEDISLLKQQLDIQMKVNTDLKKMLVASIGDDLHNKIEVLIRTKTHLTSEVDTYSGLTSNHLENIDKLSIQADLWYSKYQAANLLIRELSLDRESYLHRYIECLNALQHIILERESLYQLMLNTYRLLSRLVQRNFLKAPVPFIGDTLELAHHNFNMAQSLSVTTPTPLPFTPQVFYTYAENLAVQVIKSCKDESLKKSVSELRKPKVSPRYHPQNKYMGVVFNCCKRCKGDVTHV